MADFGAGNTADFDPEELVAALRAAAERITAQRGIRDPQALLNRIVEAAAVVLPGVSGVGISQTEKGNVASSFGTNEDIAALDGLQSQLREGPCITAAEDPPPTGVVLAHDLAAGDAERWPRFAPAAVDLGYRSLMSVGLTLQGPRRSALNLYAHEPDVFTDSAQVTVGVLGLQAAALLHGADNAAQLGIALESRDLIGQAKGILMERFGVADDAAFQMLVSSSQDTNMKLVEVARWLTREANARGTGG